jgi:hypothetical protein
MTIITSMHLKGIGGHKKRLSGKMLKQRGIRGSRGRHESEKQKGEDYLIRKEAKGQQVSEYMPMPLIDIGIDRIGELIKSVINTQFEDATQDAWSAILTDHPASEEEVIAIAREINHKHSNRVMADKFRNISLQAPIKTDENSQELTIEATIPSKDIYIPENEIDAEIDAQTPYTATSTGKINLRGYVHLDYDTFAEIKKQYPHDTLNSAIRKLAMLPPAERDKIAWHKWEDALIRVRYPWGGARACSMDINHTEHAIGSRAKLLGVKAGGTLNSYKPCPDWLNIPELAEELGVKWGVAARLIKTGKIASIRIPNYHQGHDGVFVTKEALEDYKSGKETKVTSINKQIREASRKVRLEERQRLKAKEKRLKYYHYKVRNQEKARIDIIKRYQEKQAEIANLKAVKQEEIEKLRTEKQAEIANLKAVKQEEIEKLRTEKQAEIANLKAVKQEEIEKLRTEKQAEIANLKAVKQELRIISQQEINKRAEQYRKECFTELDQLRLKDRTEYQMVMGQLLAKEKELENINSCIRNSYEILIKDAMSQDRSLPYAVAAGRISPQAKYIYPYSEGDISHFIFQNEDGDWMKACSPNRNPYININCQEKFGMMPRFVGGRPHCKVCLGILATKDRGRKD